MTIWMIPERRRFQFIMGACGVFILAMLGSLVYVCSRPQTVSEQSAERQAVRMCWLRSTETSRSAINRSEQSKACREMEKQYDYKSQHQP